MTSGRVTIADVARRAGVSTAAVSKVVRGAYGVSAEMQTKVTRAIDELGYRPHAAARALRGRTYTLGVMLSDTRNPFFPDIIEGVTDRLGDTEYQVLLGPGGIEPKTQVRMTDAMIDRSMDGLILISPVMTDAELAAIAAAALDAVQARAAAADVTIRRRTRPAPVTGEPVLLERMVGNLIDNAIRYNQAGGHLAIDTDTAGGCAVLRIRNTGREIPPEAAETLLEPFVHGQDPRVRTDGLGLGLTIVRAITLAHRGRIAISARSGGGLDITIDLPYNPTATEIGRYDDAMRSPLTPRVHHARQNQEPSC
ncbi:ATP-binding protein [Streptosporangium algeriense]|uniref:histidine kinase n=1 Tax=Streptosporangium algeriense TaxID=1682748 RepID=A0ABW3DGX8_9ACTN